MKIGLSLSSSKSPDLPLPPTSFPWATWNGSLDGAMASVGANNSSVQKTVALSPTLIISIYKIGGQGIACAATVSDTTITWGTPVVFNAGSLDGNLSIVSLTTTVAIIGYAGDGNVYANALSVSGTTITSHEIVVAAVAGDAGALIKQDDNNVMYVYDDGDNSLGYSVNLAISGTTIMAGNIVLTCATGYYQISGMLMSNGNIFIVYKDLTSGLQSTQVLIPGLFITFSTPALLGLTFSGSTMKRLAADTGAIIYYDSDAQKCLADILQIDPVTNVITKSNAPLNLMTRVGNGYFAIIPLNSSNFLAVYCMSNVALNATYLYGNVIAVNNTVMTAGSEVEISQHSTAYLTGDLLTANRAILGFSDIDNSGKNSAIVLKAA